VHVSVHNLRKVCSQICIVVSTDVVAYTPAHALVAGAQDTCSVHPRPTTTNTHTPAHARQYRRSSNDFAMKTLVNYLRLPETSFRSTVNKSIELNYDHNDSLAEPNIQRRACWFNTLDCRAAPVPHLRSTSYVCSLCPFDPPKKQSKFKPAHDAVAAVLLHKHHPIIRTSVGPIQLIDGSPSRLATCGKSLCSKKILGVLFHKRFQSRGHPTITLRCRLALHIWANVSKKLSRLTLEYSILCISNTETWHPEYCILCIHYTETCHPAGFEPINPIPRVVNYFFWSNESNYDHLHTNGYVEVWKRFWTWS